VSTHRPAVRCSARRTTGEPCGAYAMVGGTVCHAHGGAAGQVKRKAAVRVAEAKAASLADLMGAGPVSDPLTALLDLAGQAVVLTDALRAMVARLEDVGTDGVAPELSAYLGALGRAESILVAITRLDLDARLVRISEAEAAMLATMVLAVLEADELALTEAQVATARSLVAARLRVVGP